MPDLISGMEEHLPTIGEHLRRKPEAVEIENVEDMVQHAMFETYAGLYKEYPESTREELIGKVARKYNKSPEEITKTYVKFRWFGRARKYLLQEEDSNIPAVYSNAIDEMLASAGLISKLGTRLIADYLVNVNPASLTAKDAHKLGMLVVECIRVTNEVNGGGKSAQQQGTVVNLLIGD